MKLTGLISAPLEGGELAAGRVRCREKLTGAPSVRRPALTKGSVPAGAKSYADLAAFRPGREARPQDRTVTVPSLISRLH